MRHTIVSCQIDETTLVESTLKGRCFLFFEPAFRREGEGLLFGHVSMYSNLFESVNEDGWDPIVNNVVYVHPNLYELDLFVEARSSNTNLLFVANAESTWHRAKRRTIKGAVTRRKSWELGSRYLPSCFEKRSVHEEFARVPCLFRKVIRFLQ